MNKRSWIVLVLVVAVFFGLIIWYRNSAETENAMAYTEKLDETKLVTKDDVIKAQEETLGRSLTDKEKENIIEDNYLGPTDAKVVVIEYEDFACSHCQAFSVYTEKIQEDYKDRVLFIQRDFSLSYPNSVATLSAAETVKRLGGSEAYWKMNKLLFQDEKWISSAVSTNERKEIFSDYAGKSGVDVDEFSSLLADTKITGVQDKIDRDKELGKKAGVTGTPTWFVDGKQVDELSDSAIRAAIDKALDENK